MKSQPVILFDGVCNLCTWGVRWIIRHDRRGVFRFASRDSRAAAGLLHNAGEVGPLPQSMILIDEMGAHYKSDAAIRIAARLGFPWSMAKAWLILPRPVRDWLYNRMALNRYRLFGKRDSCMIPDPELRARFLDADEAPKAGTGHAA